MAVASNFGHMGGIITIEGLPIYPQSEISGDRFSEQIVIEHFKHWTKKRGLEQKAVLVVLYDIWPLDKIGKLCQQNQIPLIFYMPVDWLRLDPPMRDKLPYAFEIVSFSKYGERLIREAGFDNVRTIYLGCDTRTFRPVVPQIDKGWLKNQLGFPDPETFLIGIFEMNKDPMRKAIPTQLEGIKIFKDNNPDVKAGIYLHMTPIGGHNIPAILKLLGLEGRFPEPYDYMLGWNNLQLAKAYNSLDCLLMATAGEGYGYPIAEAQSCGIPVVASDSTSMTELLEPTPELLVRMVGSMEHKREVGLWMSTPHRMTLPDPYDTAEKLELVYERGEGYYRKKLRRWALKNYSWRKIRSEWMEFLDFVQEALEARCFFPPEPSKMLQEMSKEILVVE